MFVRTKDGKIFDCYVSEQMGKPIYYPKRSKTNGYIDWNEVYKKSENIIDILEEGDYVNGDLVLFAGTTTWDNDGNVLDKRVHINHNGYDWWLREDLIKSIVTKEMFSSMEYRLGDE